MSVLSEVMAQRRYTTEYILSTNSGFLRLDSQLTAGPLMALRSGADPVTVHIPPGHYD